MVLLPLRGERAASDLHMEIGTSIPEDQSNPESLISKSLTSFSSRDSRPSSNHE
jgi:hypothetical protein